MCRVIILSISCLIAFNGGFSQSTYSYQQAAKSGFQLTNFSGRQQNQYHEINWQVYNETQADLYIVERRASMNEPFREVQRIGAAGNNVFNNYSVKIPSIAAGETFYRIVPARRGGGAFASNVISVGNRMEQEFKASVYGGTLYVNLPDDAKNITFHSMDGKLLFQQTVMGGRGMTAYPLSRFSRGMMVVSVLTQRGRLTTKVVY